MSDKFVIPTFSSEMEEAEWWDSHQDLVAEKFEQAAAAGELGHGRVAKQALKTSPESGAPAIEISLPEQDLARARKLAFERGLQYENLLRILIHEGLDREEKRAR